MERTTRLLQALTGGDAVAAEQLLPLVYGELRQIAGRLMHAEARGHTMQPTELIHEAYVRLAGGAQGAEFDGALHFKRVAARAMRFVLVDHARAKLASKRGGRRGHVTLDTQLFTIHDRAEEMLFVHEGLEQLQAVDPQLASVVELRFFAGMTMEEIAAALEVSTRTAERCWRTARAWWVSQFGSDEDSHG